MTKAKKSKIVHYGEQLLIALPHNGLDWNQDHFRLVIRVIQIMLDREAGLITVQVTALRMRLALQEAMRLDAIEAGEPTGGPKA